MHLQETKIIYPLLIEGSVHGDERGVFMETFRADRFPDLLSGRTFVQDNMSRSVHAGTVRGLHWQVGTFAQDKLVSVLRGSVLDIVVDLRIGSTGFGRAKSFTLSENTNQQLLVPIGFAHGFCTLEDNTIVTYKCSAVYDHASERGLLWQDPALEIEWPVTPEAAILSDKDKAAPLLSELRPEDLFAL